MPNYLTDEHKASVKALVEKISLEIVKKIIEEGDHSELDFSGLYELQDHLGDYSIGDFGISYPDNSSTSISQMILDLADEKDRENEKETNDQDPWMLGQ